MFRLFWLPGFAVFAVFVPFWLRLLCLVLYRRCVGVSLGCFDLCFCCYSVAPVLFGS